MYELEKEKVPFAAMWGTKMGSEVKITNLRNGKTVFCIIADRGPGKRLQKGPRPRIIDLSKTAFEKIADPKEGLIEVEVQSVRRVQEAA